MFGFTREAIRVKVKKCEGSLPPEWRKFSVDPQITSFEVLQSILIKAFDLKGDFTICYRLIDVSGHEVYLPLLSDWDLDAAFLKAHNISIATNAEPCLCLRIDLKSFEECSDEWEVKQNVSLITHIRTPGGQEAKASPRLHGIFNQMGKTLNMVQRAFNFGEDGSATLQPPRPPLSDSEFRKFLDPVGQILYAKELRSVIYFGGIEPSLRKVVWKHILNVYPDGMTGRERMDYIKSKVGEYISLRETWKMAIANGQVVGELAYTTGMVRKDVLRTDRHHPFYAGSDDNQNIAALFNILTTYALNHPKVSYCQGMSDIASPLLVTMNDEAHAYICFCALMTRLSTNFMLDGIAMTQKFTHLAEGILYYDPEFYNYLKQHQADDLLFCYRWLLLEMKREFAFDDSLRMLEVLWSSLPADPPRKELKLYDIKFQPVQISTPPISPLVKTPRENPYTKVCALRRQSSSVSLQNYANKKATAVKRQIHSLDETAGRNHYSLDIKLKHQSLDDATLSHKSNLNQDPSPNSPKPTNPDDTLVKQDLSPHELRPRSVSPVESKSDSVILNNRINLYHTASKSNSTGLSSSMSSLIRSTKKAGHFKDLKEKITGSRIGIFSSLDRLDKSQAIKEESEVKSDGKLVKNFNEFLSFASIGKNKITNMHHSNERPKIMLTKSSFEETESSNQEPNSSSLDKTRNHSSASNSCDDTFDECSPDDSQEYFPMTTSVTRELRLEMENLDRQVFGSNLQKDHKDCSPPTEIECGEVIHQNDTVELKDSEKRKSDDIFVWENPLHQTSPKKSVIKVQTPDEDFATMVDEKLKTVTPITILNMPKPVAKCEATVFRDVEDIHAKKEEMKVDVIENSLGALMNSCEEVTEMKTSTLLPPPNEFGGGNPFLMFLCLTVLLQHRNHIMSKGMDYNEMAMHFDKMVRKHNVTKVLNQARQMYARYINQHTIAQQKLVPKNGDC